MGRLAVFYSLIVCNGWGNVFGIDVQFDVNSSYHAAIYKCGFSLNAIMTYPMKLKEVNCKLLMIDVALKSAQRKRDCSFRGR